MNKGIPILRYIVIAVTLLTGCRSIYINHSAVDNVVHQQATPPSSTPNERVAVLLPLSGKLSKAGNAIRDGLMSAYYQEQVQKPSINFYDTNQKHIAELYREAVQQGADFVIGPLDKAEAQTIASRKITVPTLLLNRLQKKVRSKKLFQFGLAPLDEIKQINHYAWEKGYRNSVVITANDNWSREIATQFKKHWQTLGGTTIGQLSYDNTEHFNKQLKQLLAIDQSEQRAQQLKQQLNTTLHYTPRRRQDIDMIFLISSPSAAQQIRPLFKYHYANTIPIFTLSRTYSGIDNPLRNRDLDGMMFLDIPQQSSQKQDIDYQRLYALGHDAYMIATNMKQLRLFPNKGFPGKTGVLYLNDNRQIERKLRWMQFKNGRVVGMN